MIGPVAATVVSLLLASAKPTVPSSPQDVAASAEIPIRSQLLVAAATTLRAPGHDAATLRSGVGAPVAGLLSLGSVGLYHASDAAIPRRAFTATGAVVYLAQLKGLPTATYPEPIYVLASSTGSRVSVWSFFKGVPPDVLLGPRMVTLLSPHQRAIMAFDPMFTPLATDRTPARYILK